MSMSIRDSVDLNIVLRYLLAIPRETQIEVTRDDALRSARRLIGRANASLCAGLRPDQVEQAWPCHTVKKKGASR